MAEEIVGSENNQEQKSLAKEILDKVYHSYYFSYVDRMEPDPNMGVEEITEFCKKNYPDLNFDEEGFRDLSRLIRDYAKNACTVVRYNPGSHTNWQYDFSIKMGRTANKEEIEEYDAAKKKADELKPQIDTALAELEEICTTLNSNSAALTWDDTFSHKMYSNGYKIDKPNAPWFKKYYEQYVRLQREIEARENLQKEKGDLITENGKLREKNQEYDSNLQVANTRIEGLTLRLGKAIKFIQRVRNSRFGRIFFRKDLKGLPTNTSTDSQPDLENR